MDLTDKQKDTYKKGLDLKENQEIDFICNSVKILSYKGLIKLKRKLNDIKGIELNINLKDVMVGRTEGTESLLDLEKTKKLLTLLLDIRQIKTIKDFEKYYFNEELLKQVVNPKDLLAKQDKNIISNETKCFIDFLNFIFSICLEISRIVDNSTSEIIIDNHLKDFIRFMLKVNKRYLVFVPFSLSQVYPVKETGEEHLERSVGIEVFDLKEKNSLTPTFLFINYKYKKEDGKLAEVSVINKIKPEISLNQVLIDKVTVILDQKNDITKRLKAYQEIYLEVYKVLPDYNHLHPCNYCGNVFHRTEQTGNTASCELCKENLSFIIEEVHRPGLEKDAIRKGLKNYGIKYFENRLSNLLKSKLSNGDEKYLELEKWVKTLKASKK